MSARKRLPASLTGRCPMFANRVDRFVLVGGRTVAAPALVMSAESRAFVELAFARVPKSKQVAFTDRGETLRGCDSEDFLFAMVKLWASDDLEKPLQDVANSMFDEMLLTCKTRAPVQMEAIFEGLGFKK